MQAILTKFNQLIWQSWDNPDSEEEIQESSFTSVQIVCIVDKDYTLFIESVLENVVVTVRKIKALAFVLDFFGALHFIEDTDKLFMEKGILCI